MVRGLIIVLFLFCHPCRGADLSPLESLPAPAEGRFRPLSAAAGIWASSEGIAVDRPLDLLWNLYFVGDKSWKELPLFKVKNHELKAAFGGAVLTYNTIQRVLAQEELLKRIALCHYHEKVSSPSNRVGSLTIELDSCAAGLFAKASGGKVVVAGEAEGAPWNALKEGSILGDHIPSAPTRREKAFAESYRSLSAALSRYAYLNEGHTQFEENWHADLEQMEAEKVDPKKIAATLEERYPLAMRLRRLGDHFALLPSRQGKGEWLSLKALELKRYDALTGGLRPIGNVTAYSDDQFGVIRSAYFKMKEGGGAEPLAEALRTAYSDLEGIPYRKLLGASLTYPSLTKLQIEHLYSRYPWTAILAVCYLALFFLFLTDRTRGAAVVSLVFVFAAHTLLLALRCYLLGRPPVSNMNETLIFVPWVAVSAAVLLRYHFKSDLPAAVAALASSMLFFLLAATGEGEALSTVQAVLDSRYWLTIHVLMVVGSYGIFILGGLLGHWVLADIAIRGRETKTAAAASKIILQTLYAGTALLIAGTILGGIWAAQSWGRFWDWDPKESWAFISSCAYLLVIHSYRFGMIGRFGLALGSVAGAAAISFTWYGVNYILGTGFHSYGFGTGGELYYWGYLLAEAIFILVVLVRCRRVHYFL